jgi:hypothetical protein
MATVHDAVGNGANPASVSGQHEAWVRKQAAPTASPPPCAAPGQLLVGGAAATARNGCDGARVLAAARARAKGGG